MAKIDGYAIRRADEDDIEDVLKIQLLNLANPLTMKPGHAFQYERTGFIVHPLLEEDFRKILKNKDDIFFVAELDGMVIGYIIALHKDSWSKQHPNWFENASIRETFGVIRSLRVIFGRQIAVLPEFQNMRLSQILISELMKESREQRYHAVIAHSLTHPLKNQKHSRSLISSGFTPMGSIIDSANNRLTWDIYVKPVF